MPPVKKKRPYTRRVEKNRPAQNRKGALNPPGDGSGVPVFCRVSLEMFDELEELRRERKEKTLSATVRECIKTGMEALTK